jgi:D-3-phosphoglycerate dehydrogenase / 2-oxoglutarate reductase
MKYKILNTIGSKYTEKAKDILKDIGDVDYLELTQGKLEDKIVDYDILVGGLELNINRNVIDSAKNLKIIATATTGLDHIDIEYAKKKNIQIISLRGETEFLDTITGTAELACGLMIDLLRLIPHSFDSVKRYEWDRESFRGHSLYGQTLGIVGLGRLGSWMAKYGNAFGMNVLGCDPYVDNKVFDKFNCEKVDFSELLKRSDVVSIHVHLNDETEKMFDINAIDTMKGTAYLVNTSRGRIVNEDKILESLKLGKLAGYATDVLAGELSFDKDFSNHPMVEYAKNNKNLIIVPHIGGMTYESREATDVFIAEKVVKSVS